MVLIAILSATASSRAIDLIAPRQDAALSVSGRVMAADTEAPIGGAQVLLHDASGGFSRVVDTSDDGRFLFQDIAPGSYVVGATKPPFVVTVHGVTTEHPRGTPIVVRRGQPVPDIVIRMPRGAAISGTVRDEHGQPLVHAHVGVIEIETLRPRPPALPFPNGPWIGATRQTNARGEFRLYGIEPGKYLLYAAPPGHYTGSPLTMSSDQGTKSKQVGYSAAFFPGASSGSSAAELTLRPGDELTGMDMQIRLVPLASITGTIVRRVAGTAYVSLRLTPVDRYLTGMTSDYSPYVEQNASTFRVNGVRPGRYWLTAEQSPGSPGAYWNRVQIDVAGKDIRDVELTLEPTATISGRIIFPSSETGAALKQSPVTVVLGSQRGPDFVEGPNPVRSAADGTLKLSNVKPGRYTVRVYRDANLATPLPVSRIQHGNRVLEDGVLIIRAGDELTDIEIHLKG